MKLLIVGAGGYGRLAKEIAEVTGFSQVDFLDDINPCAIGKIDQLSEYRSLYDYTLVAIGNSLARKNFSKDIINKTTLIHPKAVVSKTASIGKGCVIEASAIVNSEAVVKDGSFICAGAVVNHNSIVGEFCQVDCNAVVAAGAEVPDGTKVTSCTVYGAQPK